MKDEVIDNYIKDRIGEIIRDYLIEHLKVKVYATTIPVEVSLFLDDEMISIDASVDN